MKNLVSIIMNCYNGEKYLEKSLESIITQNYTNWELIFWDNQSTDNSKKIFDRFSKPNFTYHFKNQGFSNCKVYVAKIPKISR